MLAARARIPIPGATDAPRPIRGWFGEEYGINDATSEEMEKIKEDDILAWRMVFVFMVATYMRRAMRISEKVAFALEQPASPRSYMPEVVSWWETWEWTEIAKEFGLKEVTFMQGEMGGSRQSQQPSEGTWIWMSRPIR